MTRRFVSDDCICGRTSCPVCGEPPDEPIDDDPTEDEIERSRECRPREYRPDGVK